MVKLFTNPKFGLFVALVNISASVLASFYLLRWLKENLDNDKLPEGLREQAVCFLSVILVLCAVKILVCLVMIVGILKKNHHLMAAWIVVAFIYLVGIFFYTLVAICSSFINILPLKRNIFRIVCGLVSFVIQMCLFYPIYVLYKKILKIRLRRDGSCKSTSVSSHGDSELYDSDEVY